MPTSSLPALLLLLTLTTASPAQHVPPKVVGPRPSRLLAAAPRGPLQHPFQADSVRRQIPPTRWKEGALIGGVTVGLGLGLLMEGLCRSSDSAGGCGGALTGGFLVGAVLGGLTGTLIGGQFPKPDDP